MKKYIIIAAVFAACLALCAAVWPQSETIEETPAPIPAATVSAPESTIEDTTSKAEITLPAEEEKIENPQTELLYKDIPELEPVPEKKADAVEVQQTPKPESELESVYAPEPTPAPAPSQTVTDPQFGNMIYVPGFGWLECQGPGEVIYDEDIYEIGHKIGVMG